MQETDAMKCRACGNEERASEGYPCAECGTFICLICSFRGVTLCQACAAKQKGPAATPPTPPPSPPSPPPSSQTPRPPTSPPGAG